MKIIQVNRCYSFTKWHSVDFIMPGRDDSVTVTVSEAYDANSDNTVFELICVHGHLSDIELAEASPKIIKLIREEQ